METAITLTLGAVELGIPLLVIWAVLRLRQ